MANRNYVCVTPQRCGPSCFFGAPLKIVIFFVLVGDGYVVIFVYDWGISNLAVSVVLQKIAEKIRLVNWLADCDGMSRLFTICSTLFVLFRSSVDFSAILL